MTGVRRWTRWIDGHRGSVLLASIALGIVSAIVAMRLPLYADFPHLLPPRERSVRDLADVEARTRTFGNVLVAIVADDAADRGRAAAALAKRLRAIDPGLISEVIADDAPLRRFVWEHRFLFVPAAELERARDALIKKELAQNPAWVSLDDDDGEPELERLRARMRDAEREAHATGEIVSADRHTQLLIVQATFPSTDAERCQQLVAAVQQAIDATSAELPSVRIGAAGDIVPSALEHKAVLGGMIVATLATGILVGLALLLYFRWLGGVLAVLFTLTIGVLVTFALTQLFIGHLNSASAFLAAIVVGNGINFPLILLARHLEERRRGSPAPLAIEVAAAGAVRGTLAAALGSGVAYLSLIVTGFRGFRHFGIIGTAGMLACWAATYTVLPAALGVLERWRPAPLGRAPALDRLLVPALRRAVVHVRPFAAVLGGLVCVLAVRYVASDPTEYNFRNLTSTDRASLAAADWMEHIERSVGGRLAGGFVIAVDKRADAAGVAALLRREEGAITRVASMDDLVPPDQTRKLELLSEIRDRIDRHRSSFTDEERADIDRLRPPDSLLPILDADVPELLARRFTERDGTRGRLVLANNGPRLDAENGRDMMQLAALVRSMPFPSGARIAGMPFIWADMIRSVERDVLRAAAAALGAILVVVLLTVGWRREAVVILACALLGTSAMVACAALLGIKVNFLDFVALPIALGIGVDYAANVVSRAREGADAMVGAGGAVFLCSLTTMIGYGSLLCSPNRAVRSFGTVALVGEVTCLLSALLVAPALMPRAVTRAYRRRVAEG
jgi:predicted RND superfamily exporter protein